MPVFYRLLFRGLAARRSKVSALQIGEHVIGTTDKALCCRPGGSGDGYLQRGTGFEAITKGYPTMNPVDAINEAISDKRMVGLAVGQFGSPPPAKPDTRFERERDRMIYRWGVEKGLEIAKKILEGELTSLPWWAGI